MTQARINYHAFENAYQLARITSLMERLRPMFPAWVETVSVERFDRYDEKDQSTLSIDLNCAYLHFRLEVYNNFWQFPEEKQREKIIHELVHALHADVITFDRDSLIDYAKAHNPDLGAYLFREHEQRVEKFTQTMAFAFERMIAATEAIIEPRGTATDIREMAESLIRAQGKIGDGKPYTGVSTIARPKVSFDGLSVRKCPKENKQCDYCGQELNSTADHVEPAPGMWAHIRCYEDYRKGAP